MRSAGIICEYNPFHTGHKRQIDVLHGMGYDCVVCVMSGNYTQRGELAIFDKYTRAKSAVLGGTDIVLELPFPFSCMSAEGFANAGVHILSSLGVDTICFGSECADKSLLETAADAVISSDFTRIYSELIKSGLGSAAAYFKAISTVSGEDISPLSNDILGISYIAAVKKCGYDIDILPIKREGAAYNEKTLSDGDFPSASAIRELLKKNDIELESLAGTFIPERSLSALVEAHRNGLTPTRSNIGQTILSFFKLMTSDDIKCRAISRSGGGEGVAEDGCGICDRICNMARECGSSHELLSLASTSKYTDARISRVILFSLLGVSDKMMHALPEYTTLLAANEVGREFLSAIRKSCNFEIVTKPSDAPDGIQRRLVEAADALYSSGFQKKICADYFVKCHPFMLK